MKVAVLSDIHSNLEALTAALAEVERRGVDEIYCLGDIVGYGPDPGACIDLVERCCNGAVLGNHDQALLQSDLEGRLPPDGRTAIRHNRDHISFRQRAYLESLPLRLEAHGCTFVHSSPENPGAWYRLESFEKVRKQFQHFATDLCFFGHTHVPVVVSERIGVLRVREGHRYLVNPGSVGQPRDGDPRLSLAIFDSAEFTCEIVRVEYDRARTAVAVMQVGLPKTLADRLTLGR